LLRDDRGIVEKRHPEKRHAQPGYGKFAKGRSDMRKIALTLAVLAASLLPVLDTAPVRAGGGALAKRTWLSGSIGNDNNPCSRTQPCSSFAQAIALTAPGGEVNCVDPVGGAGGTLNITKSITIDCHDVFAGFIPATGSDGFSINVAGGVVTLRNLNIDGQGAGNVGIAISAAATVYLEDLTIANFKQQGILDRRRASGDQLVIRNSTLRNNNAAGVDLSGTGTTAVLENVLSAGNSVGVDAGGGNQVVVSRSLMFGNGQIGVNSGDSAEVFVDNAEIDANAEGISSSGTVVLANSDIFLNGTGISGTPQSFGNNRSIGNTTNGATPTFIGAPSSDHGEE
jgi:hypothetical protein